jgi:hypothetical protein
MRRVDIYKYPSSSPRAFPIPSLSICIVGVLHLEQKAIYVSSCLSSGLRYGRSFGVPTERLTAYLLR